MTRILIIGGTGFIGRHLAPALAGQGHEVAAIGREQLDLVRDDEAAVAARLQGWPVVINAVGVIKSQGRNRLDLVHVEGVRRLLAGCARAGVQRLIHVSALGAAVDGATLYQRTKGESEALIAAARGMECCVLRPSIVVGRGGASTLLFSALVALPLPVRVSGRVQPVHIDDLVELVTGLLAGEAPWPRVVDVVGPEPMEIGFLVAALAHWLGLPRRPFVSVTPVLLKLVAALRIGPLDPAALIMLRQGNVGDPAGLAALLGRAPRTLAAGLARHPASPGDLWQARLFLLRPVLRISLALLWIATGLLSFGLYPVHESLGILASAGLHGKLAKVALFGGAGLDLLLGVLLLLRWRPVWVGLAMLGSVAIFSLIALALPAEYWLHPFTPILKNLPLAAAVLVMMALEA